MFIYCMNIETSSKNIFMCAILLSVVKSFFKQRGMKKSVPADFEIKINASWPFLKHEPPPRFDC